MNKDFELDWIISLIKKDLTENISEPTKIKTREPSSQIEKILRNMFEEIKGDLGNPDALDKFVENQNIMNYKRRDLFFDFLREVLKRFNLDPIFEESEKGVQEKLFKICEKISEEPEYLDVLKEMINEKYPNLIDDGFEISEEEWNEQYMEKVDEELQRIRENLTINSEQYKNIKNKIKKIRRTKIDDLAEELNKMIIIGKQTWKLLLYSILSTYCPKIRINGIEKRNNIHSFLVGDISTAKSSIFQLIRRLAPKANYYNFTSKASFEGIAKKVGNDYEIGKGIVDKAKDGVLIIPDWSSTKLPYEREFLDNDIICLRKGGRDKKVYPNTTIFTASNPKSDFFRDKVILRNQIGESEGLISRFDVFIPLSLTAEKNAMIIDRITLFGYPTRKHLDVDEVSCEYMLPLSQGLRLIKGVKITKKQEEKIKRIYLKHNEDLPTRPFVIPRDLESLARLINTVACVRMSGKIQKEKGGEGYIIHVKDSDIEEAVTLWEHILKLRKSLYTSKSKEILSIKEYLYKEIVKRGKVRRDILRDEIVEREKMCCETTFYDNIKELIMEGKVKQVGERYSILVPVIPSEE